MLLLTRLKIYGMIKLLASVVLVFSTLNLFSQEINKNSFGVSAVVTGESGVYSTFGKSMGGPGYGAGSTFEAGLYYSQPFNHTFSFESGIYWHYNKISVTPSYYPGIDMSPRYYNCNLIYVPLNVKLLFAKYFFIDGGLLLNVDVSHNSNISSQTGLGTDFGCGVEIPVFKHYRIVINPFVNIFGLYKFNRMDLSESLLGDGIRITFKK
jgi:hypothetical protein